MAATITSPYNGLFGKMALILLPFVLLGCTHSIGNPNGTDRLLHLSMAALDQGHFKKARRFLERLTAQDPGNVVVWNNLAVLDFREHHLHHAEQDLARALGQDPGNPILRMNAVRLDLALGKDLTAREILLDLGDGRGHWPKGYRLLLAIADLHTGHPEEASILFREILSERPGDRLARENLKQLERTEPETLSLSGRMP